MPANRKRRPAQAPLPKTCPRITRPCKGRRQGGQDHYRPPPENESAPDQGRPRDFGYNGNTAAYRGSRDQPQGIVAELRFRRDVAKVVGLGARPVLELLLTGGDRMPPRPMRIIGVGR